jgi:hypothetical protein
VADPAAMVDCTLGTGIRTSVWTGQPADVDVIVWLDAGRLRGPCRGLAKQSMLSVLIGDPNAPESWPPYWRQIVQSEPVSRIAVLEHEEDWSRGRLRTDYAAPTLEGWYFSRTAVEPLRMAGPLIARCLTDISAGKEPAAGTTVLAQGGRAPTNTDVIRFVKTQSQRSLRLRRQARGRSTVWFSAIRSGSGPWLDVPAPPGHQYADPFLVTWEDRDWLYVEDIPPDSPKARLTALELNRDGSFGEPAIVMDRPFHLSYPCVFASGDGLFMIPETGENNTVELYRAASVPNRWEKVRTLKDNAPLVDTTPFFHEGVWYFFTTTFRWGIETYLFYSERLDGEWRYHPANPICSDVRYARGAGALFERNGRLIRPAQDCSVRYGYAVVLNEVRKISPGEYEESPIETILPNWRPGLLATHTLNHNARFEVMDGVRYSD